MRNTLPTALTRLLEHIPTSLKKFDPYDHYAACWVTLILMICFVICGSSDVRAFKNVAVMSCYNEVTK